MSALPTMHWELLITLGPQIQAQYRGPAAGPWGTR